MNRFDLDNANSTYAPPVILGADGLPARPAPRTDYQDGLALPHQLTFQALMQSSWKQYWPDRYDEARRVPSPDFHLVMWRQLHLQTMMQERLLALQDLEWELDVDDDRDPHQTAVRDGLTKILQQTPHLYQYLYSLQLAVWSGRAGVQQEWVWDTLDLPAVQAQAGLPGVMPAVLTTGRAPRRVLRIRQHVPVNGDKILFKTDHTPMIGVYSPEAPNIPGLAFEPTAKGMYAAPLYGTWRTRFAIHRHWAIDADFFDIESQDAVHGVGVRSTLAWFEWMRQEWLAQAVVHLQRFGLGVRLWYYDGGNEKALTEVQARAKDQSDRSNIFVPYWRSDRGSIPSVENVEVPVTGAEVVLRLVEHVEYWEQRFISGQALFSNHPNSGGIGGGDAADAGQSDRRNVVRSDARMLAETMTGTPREPGPVWITFSRTYPEYVGKFACPRWKFNVPEEKSKDILAGVQTFVGLGGTVREKDARALLPGFREPEEGEATLGGAQGMPVPGQEDGDAPGGEEGGKGDDEDKGKEGQKPSLGGDQEQALGGAAPKPLHFGFDSQDLAAQYWALYYAAEPVGSHWVTIGGTKGESGEHQGGHAVLIDADGRILRGNVPKGWQGKHIGEAFRHHEDSTKRGETPFGDEPKKSEKPLDSVSHKGDNQSGGAGTSPAPKGEGGKMEAHEMTAAEYADKWHVDPTRGMSTNNYSKIGQGVKRGYEAVLQKQADPDRAVQEVVSKTAAMQRPKGMSERQFEATKEAMIRGAELAAKEVREHQRTVNKGKYNPRSEYLPESDAVVRALAGEIDKKYPATFHDHRHAVFAAMQQGKQVPLSVLAEYPDLVDVPLA